MWVTDSACSVVHMFEDTVMPPRQMMSVRKRDEPSWLTFSANGRRVYAATGDIIDATSNSVITV